MTDTGIAAVPQHACDELGHYIGRFYVDGTRTVVVRQLCIHSWVVAMEDDYRTTIKNTYPIQHGRMALAAAENWARLCRFDASH